MLGLLHCHSYVGISSPAIGFKAHWMGHLVGGRADCPLYGQDTWLTHLHAMDGD